MERAVPLGFAFQRVRGAGTRPSFGPPMVSTPHDSLFKETFNQPDLARSELEPIFAARGASAPR
jgi:hypothetical protein